MAVYTVSNAGGNYNVGTTWVGGIVPSTTDTVDFTATSGNLTISVAATCAGIDFTNYVNTITINQSFIIKGNINIGTGGYNVGGGNTMYAGATGTITSNGTSWKGNFGFIGNSQTYTLTDDLTVNGTLTFNVSAVGTINGFNIYAKFNVQQLNFAVVGSTNLIFAGTGTWSNVSSAHIGLNIIINTTGTITFGTNIYYGVGTFTYTSGTVITTGNNFYLRVTCNIDCAGINFNNFQFLGTSQVYTLLDDLTVNGDLTLGAVTNVTINGFSVTANASVLLTTTGNVAGTTTLIFGGTGIWSHSAGFLGLNTIINTAGTITLGPSVRYQTGILTYTAGTIITTGSTLIIGGACTLDTSGMNWNNVTTAVAASINLISILIVGGTLSIGGASFVTNYCHVKGNLIITSNTGTAGGILINGTGNQTWSGTQAVRGGLVINKPSGTLTVNGSVSFSNGILTYIAGTVVTTGSTLTVPALGTLDTNGIIWNNVTFSNAATRTLLSDLTCNTFQLVGGASIINGFNIYFNSLIYNANAGSIGTGTSTFIFKGTGTWSHSTTGRFNNNLVFDTGISGVTTFTNQTYITNGTVTHISGTVNQGVYTVTLAGSATMNTSGMTWGTILVNDYIITLLSTLKADRIQNNGFTTMTFAGAFGFEVNKFYITTAFNVTVTLVNSLLASKRLTFFSMFVAKLSVNVSGILPNALYTIW